MTGLLPGRREGENMPFGWRRVVLKPAVLDPLLALPSAAYRLTEDFGFVPTGLCSICFRAADTRAFRDAENDVRGWLNHDAGKTMPVEATEDSYGFTWMVIRRLPDEFQLLIADVHAASSKLADDGFGPQLLCSVTEFRDGGDRQVAMVYVYKHGTFYPFAPQPERSRNTDLELSIRDGLKGILQLEADLKRWFPVWDAPGL